MKTYLFLVMLLLTSFVFTGEIAAQEPPGDEFAGEFEITGILMAIGDDYIVISGVPINLTAMNIEGEWILQSWYKAEGFISSEGAFIAHFIQPVQIVVSLTEADEAAIYAAVIRRLYQHDHTFGDGFESEFVYILSTTDDRIGDPALQSDPSPISAAVQAQVSALTTDLSTNVVWVNSWDDIPIEPSTGQIENGVVFTLGNMHLRFNGSVLVSCHIWCGNLCARGYTYVVDLVDGIWTWTDYTYFGPIS